MAITTGLGIVREAVRARFSPRIVHLILHVTNLCNFRCNHCFIEFEKKPKDLTFEEIKPIAEKFRGLIWLDIGGGEPFLRDDLAEIVGLFAAAEVSIPSNGWFTDKMLATLGCLAALRPLESVILTLSIDGLPETHDEIRKRNGSFERLEESFRAIRRQFPALRIKINTVINHRNVAEIPDLMKMVYEQFRPDYHGVLFLRGKPINEDYRLPPPDEIRKLEFEIEKIQARYSYGRSGLMSNITKNYQSLKRDIANRILEEEDQVIPCWGGRSHLVIYPDGKVAPCELLPPIGSIRETPLNELLTSDAMRHAVRGIRAKECHCTHDCNFMENILFDFKSYPELVFGRKGVS